MRTCHGEEEPKGFNVIGYIPETGAYIVEKVVNEYTFNFSTLKINNEYIRKHTADEIVKYAEKYKEENSVDKLSIKLKCVDTEETSLKIEMLRKYFSKNNDITFSIKMMSEKSYEKETNTDVERDKKPYLADGLDIVERIRLWASIERKIELSAEDIVKYITPQKMERKGIL